MGTFSVLDENQIKSWVFDLGLDNPVDFYNYLKTLESQEEWVFEEGSDCYKQFSKLADTLAEKLEKRPDRNFEADTNKLLGLLRILAYRNFSASFRFLAILHRLQPTVTARLLELCMTDQVAQIQPEAMLFMTRLKLLIKKECLQRIFGRQRRQEILTLLKEVKKS